MIDNGLFGPDSLADQITIYTIYDPIIRNKFADFINLWNRYKIRMQKNCLYVISGILMDLYNLDNIGNWGISVRDKISVVKIFCTMFELLENIEIDEFLILETN